MGLELFHVLNECLLIFKSPQLILHLRKLFRERASRIAVIKLFNDVQIH